MHQCSKRSNHRVSISLGDARVGDARAGGFDATYKFRSFERDPIDDGMVPLT